MNELLILVIFATIFIATVSMGIVLSNPKQSSHTQHWHNLLKSSKISYNPDPDQNNWKWAESMINGYFYTGWKLHVYFDDRDVQDKESFARLYHCCKEIFNLLNSKKVKFKTISNLGPVLNWISTDPTQKGKFITIYSMSNSKDIAENIKSIQETSRQVSSILSKYYSVPGNYNILGDKHHPYDSSGRLFYRYDLNVPGPRVISVEAEYKKLYDANRGGAKYNIPNNPDIFTEKGILDFNTVFENQVNHAQTISELINLVEKFKPGIEKNKELPDSENRISNISAVEISKGLNYNLEQHNGILRAYGEESLYDSNMFSRRVTRKYGLRTKLEEIIDFWKKSISILKRISPKDLNLR